MSELTAAPLTLFVYGSLKRGYRNHEAYCSGYSQFRTATLRGKLYRQADGYPMLVVPPENILATGTSQLADDLKRFATIAGSLTSTGDEQPSSPGSSAESPGSLSEPWIEIHGEIYTWPAEAAANVERLAKLDRLEDCYPDRPDCLYHRVIVLAKHEAGEEPAWVYVAPAGQLPSGTTPMGRSWP